MVKKMWNNGCDHLLSPPFKENKRWNASFNWSYKNPSEDNDSFSKGIYLSKKTFNKYKTDAELKISQIQDPLWQKTCDDILRILGPLAFKGLWKIKFISVSAEGRRAYFSCPNESLALTLQHYHFVIIGALKKFYPFLSSLEVEINEDIQSNVPVIRIQQSA